MLCPLLDWTPVTKGEKYYVKLEETPLRIWTDSVLGSDDEVDLEIFNNQSDDYYAFVEFTFKASGLIYEVYECPDSYRVPFPVTPPAAQEKVRVM